MPLKNPRREAKKCTTFVHNNNNAKKKDTKQNQAEKKIAQIKRGKTIYVTENTRHAIRAFTHKLVYMSILLAFLLLHICMDVASFLCETRAHTPLFSSNHAKI